MSDDLAHRRSTLEGLAVSIRMTGKEVLRLDNIIKNWKDPYMPSNTVEQDLEDNKKLLMSLLEKYFKLEDEMNVPRYLPFRKLYREMKKKP